MRWLALAAIAALSACGGGDADLVDAAPLVLPDSAPARPLAPAITSFTASPSQLSSGFPTSVTWTWTYQGLPFPEPTCSIDNSIGPVTNHGTSQVTLSQITTFTLTCTNSAGSATRPVVVTVPAVAPTISTFAANPMTVPISTATNVTWSWTYVTPPSPAPTCSISPTVGPVTNGQTTSLTEAFGTSYTLSCTNAAGTRTASVFVNAATAPAIATFTATPMTVTANTATNIQLAWTYANTPSPVPSCSINQGIGAVTSPTTRSQTLAATTTYTLTCTNTGGMAMQNVTVTVQ